MKIIKNFSFCLLSLLCCACCSNLNYNSHQFPIINKIYTVPHFDAIAITNTDVILQNGSRHIEVKAPTEDIKVWVKNRTLYATNHAKNKNQSVIIINIPSLRSIQVNGYGRLFADDFHSKGLTIATYDKAELNIKGVQRVTEIIQRNHSKINLSWVSAEHLTVDGNGTGLIHLAGVVDNMLVKLTGNTNLDARYLRAKVANLFVTNSAKIDVSAIDKLNAYVVDKATVFYYKIPKQLTVVSKNQGKVLHTDWVY